MGLMVPAFAALCAAANTHRLQKLTLLTKTRCSCSQWPLLLSSSPTIPPSTLSSTIKLARSRFLCFTAGCAGVLRPVAGLTNINPRITVRIWDIQSAMATAQNRVMQPSQMRSYNLRVIKDTMIAVGAQAVMDIISVTHPEANDDMDDATAVRVEAALTAASRTSFCTDAYVKAGINAIALSSASVTRIRDTRAEAARRSSVSTARVTRTTDDSQLPACMRAEVKAHGDTGAVEVHGRHRFADSNRRAAELRPFPPAVSFSEIVQRN